MFRSSKDQTYSVGIDLKESDLSRPLAGNAISLNPLSILYHGRFQPYFDVKQRPFTLMCLTVFEQEFV